jgi:prepilin-type N-terminal cleavage/methylation domain-containing protein
MTHGGKAMQDHFADKFNKRLLVIGYLPMQRRKTIKMNNRAGFSLMELMVTIAIIGILSAIVIPNGLSWRRNAQFNSAVREVKANMERTRMFAIRSNVPADVVFVDGANTFSTVRRNRVAGALVAVPQVHQLDSGITLTSNFTGDVLNFNNRGLAFNAGVPNPGTVTVNGPSGLTNNIAVSIDGSSQVQ